MSDETNPPDLEVSAAAVSDGAYTLLVADFSDTSMAWEAYEALRSVEDGRSVEIEGVIVVNRSTDGKLEVQKATDHSTKSGLKWGVVGGIALGVIFPPSILGSAAVVGSAGALAWQAASASPPRGSRAAARERNPAWALRSARTGVRSRRRQDPEGARAGRRHRRVRHRQGRGRRHQGSSQGSPEGRRLITEADPRAAAEPVDGRRIRLSLVDRVSPSAAPRRSSRR